MGEVEGGGENSASAGARVRLSARTYSSSWGEGRGKRDGRVGEKAADPLRAWKLLARRGEKEGVVFSAPLPPYPLSGKQTLTPPSPLRLSSSFPFGGEKKNTEGRS